MSVEDVASLMYILLSTGEMLLCTSIAVRVLTSI